MYLRRKWESDLSEEKHLKTLRLQRVIRLVTEHFAEGSTYTIQTHKRLKESMETDSDQPLLRS